MGQYQQWLHDREIERQLHAQIENMKKELRQLQAQTQQLAQYRSEHFPDESSNLILQALATHFHEPPLPLNQSLPAIPRSDMSLLPEDMPAFFDQHTPTEPQIELPHWFRSFTGNASTNGPVDLESLRNNRLVQRWFERWHKQAQGSTHKREETS